MLKNNLCGCCWEPGLYTGAQRWRSFCYSLSDTFLSQLRGWRDLECVRAESCFVVATVCFYLGHHKFCYIICGFLLFFFVLLLSLGDIFCHYLISDRPAGLRGFRLSHCVPNSSQHIWYTGDTARTLSGPVKAHVLAFRQNCRFIRSCLELSGQEQKHLICPSASSNSLNSVRKIPALSQRMNASVVFVPATSLLDSRNTVARRALKDSFREDLTKGDRWMRRTGSGIHLCNRGRTLTSLHKHLLCHMNVIHRWAPACFMAAVRVHMPLLISSVVIKGRFKK